MKRFILTLTLFAVAAVNAAPKEVFLARNLRVKGGVQSYERLRTHLHSPVGQNDVNLMLNKLRLTADQKAAVWRQIETRLQQPLNSPGGVYRVGYPQGTRFDYMTFGTGQVIDAMVRLGVDGVGYTTNVTYPSATTGIVLMKALVVFTTCGNMGIGAAVEEKAPPTPPKPPVETITPEIVPPTPPKPPVETVTPEIVPVEVPVDRVVERVVDRPVPAAPLLSLNRSASGSGWAQNQPDNVVSWQKGSIGAGVTWQVGRQRMTTTTTTPTPGQPCPTTGGPPPSGTLPQPTPTPAPNPIGSVPANPGGVTDVGDGANGTTNVPPATPIGTPNGSVQPVPAPGSTAGPPPNTTLRPYSSQRR
ncbi:MAG: hypothetical protein Q7S64_03495 [bacterium]|nr:hypothetical protein [bacterium]